MFRHSCTEAMHKCVLDIVVIRVSAALNKKKNLSCDLGTTCLKTVIEEHYLNLLR